MEALRDPFSKVHPFFWPVLWLSLRAFLRWTRRMIEAGHGYGGLEIELTWYGWIHVRAIDLSETGKAFRRHIMGAAREDDWNVLARASGRVKLLLNPKHLHHSRAGGNPWTNLATGAPGGSCDPWVPASAGMSAKLGSFLNRGTGPPLCDAPLLQTGRGVAPPSPATPNPRPARALVLALELQHPGIAHLVEAFQPGHEVCWWL